MAPGMNVGREGAICEYIEIMRIPPRLERRCAAYNCITGNLQYDGADCAATVAILPRSPPMRGAGKTL
jgi:hypothetical protein